MKKKVIALALTACMVPVGSGVDVMAAKGDSGDKITLNWQSYDSYDKYQKVVEAFEKENPDIEINFEEVSDYATKILTEATAGDLPDLINCNTGNYTDSCKCRGITEIRCRCTESRYRIQI